MGNVWCPEAYRQAWDFATRAHAGQTYGGPRDGERVPYINHIASVAMEVSLAAVKTPEPLNTDLAVQCALLHDTIEDTEIHYEDIETTFGAPVAQGVMALTKSARLETKQAQMADSIERIMQQPREVWMVKLADRVTNLYQPPFYWDNEKILQYQAEGQFIFDQLHSANSHLANRLAAQLEAYPSFLR